MTSTISTHIKKRTKANDVFITPLGLAKKHIDIVMRYDRETGLRPWYDPFKNSGSYYNQYPTDNKVYSEILEGKDFFDYNLPVDVICSNPPYSMIDRVLEQSVSLQPRIISYLIGVNNLTCKRLEFMEANGYILVNIHMCKVFEWYGMSFIVTWVKDKSAVRCLDYDRIVWR